MCQRDEGCDVTDMRGPHVANKVVLQHAWSRRAFKASIRET